MGTNFKKGDVVWARLKGYPYWPAIIAEPKDGKKPPKNTLRWVYFFGSKNYSWIDVSQIVDYAKNKSELETKGGRHRATFNAALEDVEKFLNGKEDPFDQLITATSTPKGGRKPKKDKEGSGGKIVKRRKNSLDESVDGSDDSLKSPEKETSVSPKPKKKKILFSDETESSFVSSINSSYGSQSGEYHYTPRPSASKTPDYKPVDLQNPSEELLKKNITPSDKTFGFIGVGVMGSRLLKNLLHSKHNLLIWNRTEEKCNPFEEYGVKVGRSPYDVVAAADVTFLCVGAETAAFDLLFGSNLLYAIKDQNKRIVNFSDVSSTLGEGMADLLESYSCPYLEARVVGGPEDADKGVLKVFAAGNRELYDDCASAFASFSTACTYIGEEPRSVGTYHSLLLSCRQVVVKGLTEAVVIGQKAGLSASQLIGLLDISPYVTSPLVQLFRELREKDPKEVQAQAQYDAPIITSLLRTIASEDNGKFAMNAMAAEA